MKLHALFCALAISFSSLSQTPSNIESVEYDPENNRWYVSCGNGPMMYTDNAGVSWDYIGTYATYGMEIIGGFLYTINNNIIMCYDLETHTIASTTGLVTGATFLNGMGSSEDILIISDFGTGRILKVDISDPYNIQYSTLVASTGTAPNGVVIDSDGTRAVVVNWGGNSDILGIDIETGEVTTLIDGTGLGNCDGIDIDSEGNYYVSSWSPARITKFSSDFSENETVVSSGLSNPADISYAMEIDTLAVANSGNNQVTFHSFAENTESVSDLNDDQPWVELHGKTIVFTLSKGGVYELRAYRINGQIAGFHEVNLLPGTTKMELDRLPQAFSKGGIISVKSQDSVQQSFKYFK